MKKIIFLTLCSFMAHADVNKSLSGFFKKMATSSNITRAGAYKDQQGGFYTGGNLFARNQVMNTQLASIQLPNYQAGCGGIDMFMGSFSHISSERLIEAMKAIGSNMGSYAMMLALETMSPAIKNILEELENMANMINNANLNSCELAATAVGSVWPRSQETQGHLCKAIGGNYGVFSDYAASRQGCGAGGQRDSTLAKAENDDKFKKMLGSEFNLAWKAIQENAFLSKDKKLAEFFMSISGTIVSVKEKETMTDHSTDDVFKIYTKTSLATKNSLLNAILHGGEVSVYRCADRGGDKCLKVEQSIIKIDPDKALVNKVRDTLLKIQEKIYDDVKLTDDEIAFLGSTRLPFYKILNVSTAYHKASASPVQVMDYAELGAVDILFQYLTEIIDVVNESVDHIRLTQIDDTQLRDFQKDMRAARSEIIKLRMGSFKQVEQVIAIVKKTELLEKSLLHKAGVLSTGDI